MARFPWEKFDREDPAKVLLRHTGEPEKKRAVPTYVLMNVKSGGAMEQGGGNSLDVSAHGNGRGEYRLEFSSNGFKAPSDVDGFVATIGKNLKFVLETCSNWNQEKILAARGREFTQVEVPFSHRLFPRDAGLVVVYWRFYFDQS